MTDSSLLLQDYVKNGNEAAFRELVERYVNLVYSISFRRVGGDAELAKDVVQSVFCDLAQKARSLLGDVQLGGWLHRHTCFVASNALRREQRRYTRERQSVGMNSPHEPTQSSWQELAPELDRAVDELDTPDRTAIVLRFYEQADLRTVGATLGISDDAAQKRVSRALTKLRTLLEKRGLTLAVSTLSASLATQTVMSAPTGLGTSVSERALASTAFGAGLLLTLIKLMTSSKSLLAGGAVVAAAVIAAIALNQTPSDSGSTETVNDPGLPQTEATASTTPLVTESSSSDPLDSSETHPNETMLRLEIVAADSGKPVPNVVIDYREWGNSKVTRKDIQSTRFGIIDVPFSADDTTQLELTTQIDGFADTRLYWRPDRGEKIPEKYTLRLDRPVRIGGFVFDGDGLPVSDAKVGFNHEEDPAAEARPENHRFGWIQVRTDDAGHWSINRIAENMIRRIYGSARHPDYVNSKFMFVSRESDAEKQLREGGFIFRLGSAVVARGTVLDASGSPVPDAKVLVGNIGSSGRRETKVAPDGTFVVPGCKPGKNLLSAEAEGFATTTIEADLVADAEPFQLVLEKGRILRLRVLNEAGEPVSNANVWLDTFQNRPTGIEAKEPVWVQTEFNPKTDEEGRVYWDSAPDQELSFDVHGKGYMRVSGFKVRPDGEEHIVTLPPALVISGTVRDEDTGDLIPKFRIISGAPRHGPLSGSLRPQWSSIDRFWLTFEGGQFRHSFEEPIIGGMVNPGYILKFEAEGYAPLVSRAISADEGEVSMGVALRVAFSTLVSVVLPDGRAAAFSDIGLVTPDTRLELAEGGFSRVSMQGGSLRATDAKGQFKLPPDDSIQGVIVAHREGFAEVSSSLLISEPVISLQPWGRIDGTWRSGDQPASGRMLKFEFGTAGSRTVSTSYQAYRTETDADGRFVFEKVPPGQHRLVRLQQFGESGWSHVPLKEVDIESGETTIVELGTSGYVVTAHLSWPATLKREPSWQVFASIHTPFPQLPPEVSKDPEALAAWRSKPEIQSLIANAQSYPLTENSNGTWTAEDVFAGDYELSVRALGNGGEGEGTVVQANLTVPITVPAEPALGALDLGELRMNPAQ